HLIIYSLLVLIRKNNSNAICFIISWCFLLFFWLIIASPMLENWLIVIIVSNFIYWRYDIIYLFHRLCIYNFLIVSLNVCVITIISKTSICRINDSLIQ